MPSNRVNIHFTAEQGEEAKAALAALATGLLVYQYAKIRNVTSGALEGSLDDLGRRFARKVSRSAPAA